MRASIIIPNWNGLTHLPVCLDSLRAQTCRDFETIVVDNASSDGSPAYLTEHHPEVRLLALPENRGFTGACNAGIAASHGEIVILLNNDTETDPHWLAEVLAAFDRYPQAGAVASKMLLFDRRDTLHTAGDLFTRCGLAQNRGVWQPDTDQYPEGFVFSACGGSAAYRRAMLNDVGLLDDAFFFSHEDVDLAWRAHLRGWPTIYTPRAVVYHKLSASGGGVTASFYDGRNRLWLLAKSVPDCLWRRYWPRFIRAQLTITRQALQHWRGAASRATLRGQLVGLLTLPRMLARRRAVQATRTASTDYLESVLSDC